MNDYYKCRSESSLSIQSHFHIMQVNIKHKICAYLIFCDLHFDGLLNFKTELKIFSLINHKILNMHIFYV